MASPGEPALCQLYRHTFVCYKLAVTRQGAGRTETKSHVVDCLVLVRLVIKDSRLLFCRKNTNREDLI